MAARLEFIRRSGIQVSMATWRRWLESGALPSWQSPSTMCKGRYYVSLGDIEAFIARGAMPADERFGLLERNPRPPQGEDGLPGGRMQ
ncbi:MAG TPA: hypothetical protein VGZ29_05660 [Terriglobia bacterium]|nr:hypothetical protein [Terriglobia bacterium]